MPVDRRDAFLALLLISLAVPLQYFLLSREGNKDVGIEKNAQPSKSLLATVRGVIRSVSDWLEWMDDLASDLERSATEEEPNEDGVR